MDNQSVRVTATAAEAEKYANVNPLEAARRQRVVASGDALATAGAEVHGDNSGGIVRGR